MGAATATSCRSTCRCRRRRSGSARSVKSSISLLVPRSAAGAPRPQRRRRVLCAAPRRGDDAMDMADTHREAAEAALMEARRNPVMSAEQWFRAAQVHALLAIEARIAQIVDSHADRLGLIGSR